MRRGWYPALLILFACRLDVGFEDTRFFCGGGGTCPSRQSCGVDDYCHLSEAPPDAGPTPVDAGEDLADAPTAVVDAEPVDAAPPGTPDAARPDAAVPCLLGNVADDFEDGTRAPFWQAFVPQPPAAVSETGGRLRIALAVNTAGSRYAGYTYVHDTDARGQRVQVEVVTVPNGSSQANAFLKLQAGINFNNQASFLVQAGKLFLETADASGVILSRKQLTYSPVDHRFWALEESGGKVSFETSPDGVNWSLRDQQPVPFDFAAARVSLGAGTWQPEASPGVVQFDNLNGGSPTDCFGAPP